MTPYQKRMNPFIRRMAEDMQLRNFSPSTIDSYTFHVDKFCQHFGKPADQLGPEEIRQFQLCLVNERKVSWSSFNQDVCGLRFLYTVTLGRDWSIKHIPFGKRPKQLPTVDWLIHRCAPTKRSPALTDSLIRTAPPAKQESIRLSDCDPIN